MSEKTTVIKEINSLNKQIGQAIKSGADATVDRLEKKLDKAFSKATKAGVGAATIERLDARTPRFGDMKGDMQERVKEAKDKYKGGPAKTDARLNPLRGKGGADAGDDPTFKIFEMMKRPDLPKPKSKKTYSRGGSVTKNYMNPVKVVNNLKGKK